MKSDVVDNVKNSAAKSLEKIGKPAAEPLIELLEKTKDVETLIRIVQALGDIGDKGAVKPMERIYNQASNPLLKNETAKALNKIPD
jgi:HEAT repeat protein